MEIIGTVVDAQVWREQRDALVGRQVAVGGRPRVKRTIVYVLDTPGAVHLDRPAEGFRSWNVCELRPAD